MTSNVSGKRRAVPIHVPENDQIMGGFDGMSVKVALSTTCWCTSPQHIDSNLYCLSERNRTGGPGAIAWILVLRTCL